jgi:hypothetical protein
VKKTPKAGWDDEFVIPPPSSVDVSPDKKIILYKPDGTPLIRPIGFIKS